MAGIGKTPLALQWAHLAAGDYPDGQLYVNLRGFDSTGRVVSPGDALRDMLHTLGALPASLPDTVDARASMYRTLLSTRRMLLVLDNARDTDQVRPLLPGGGQSLVVITSRNSLAGVVALHGARLVRLDPFTAAEAHEFLARRVGAARADAAPAAVQRLARACTGLPLALAVVAARAVANPSFPLDLLAAELANTVAPLDLLAGGQAELDLREVFSWSQRALRPGRGTDVPHAGRPPRTGDLCRLRR